MVLVGAHVDSASADCFWRRAGVAQVTIHGLFAAKLDGPRPVWTTVTIVTTMSPMFIQQLGVVAYLPRTKICRSTTTTPCDLRRLAIGRKNGMFFGSAAGGEVAATMYTLIDFAARHQLDLWAYVDDVLRYLAAGDYNLAALLPDRWAIKHPPVDTNLQKKRVRITLSQENKPTGSATKSCRANLVASNAYRTRSQDAMRIS